MIPSPLHRVWLEVEKSPAYLVTALGEPGGVSLNGDTLSVLFDMDYAGEEIVAIAEGCDFEVVKDFRRSAILTTRIDSDGKGFFEFKDTEDLGTFPFDYEGAKIGTSGSRKNLRLVDTLTGKDGIVIKGGREIQVDPSLAGDTVNAIAHVVIPEVVNRKYGVIPPITVHLLGATKEKGVEYIAFPHSKVKLTNPAEVSFAASQGYAVPRTGGYKIEFIVNLDEVITNKAQIDG
jgi:hypothetical protein